MSCDYDKRYLCNCSKCQCLCPVFRSYEVCLDCKRDLHGYQQHFCFDCGGPCDCGGNKQDCNGCGCLEKFDDHN